METAEPLRRQVLARTFLNFLRGMETVAERSREPRAEGFLNFLRGMETGVGEGVACG